MFRGRPLLFQVRTADIGHTSMIRDDVNDSFGT